MEIELTQKLEEQDKKIDAIYRSVERTRKYILWTFVFNIIIFILPLVGLVIAIPWFLKTIASVYNIAY
jgi:TRAP-type mannitol/chloroaromatic compound transport system permease small subunit